MDDVVKPDSIFVFLSPVGSWNSDARTHSENYEDIEQHIFQPPAAAQVLLSEKENEQDKQHTLHMYIPILRQNEMMNSLVTFISRFS